MKMLKEILQLHADAADKLTVQVFSADRSDSSDREQTPIQDYVLIEGSRESLRFLGELITAFVSEDCGCNFDIHPQGAGSAHFTTKSSIGLYLHVKPCDLDRPDDR